MTTTDTKTSAPPLVRVHPADNVVVAVRALEAGAEFEIEGVRLTPSRDIPPGHKVALQPIAKGSGVIKYGERIGSATAEIAPGEHVHSHNLATDLREGDDYAYDPSAPGEPPTPIDDGRTFRGYVRPTGRVGTRNEIWIINTVGCVNTSAERIARNAERMLEGNPRTSTASTPSATPTGAASSGTTSKTPNACSPGSSAIPTPAACSSWVLAARTTNSTISSRSRAT